MSDGLRRFFSWYLRTWFDFPTRRPYPATLAWARCKAAPTDPETDQGGNECPSGP